MTTTIIHTDLDPSGNIAVGPNFPRKESSSANSSFEKGAHLPISDRGAHPLPTYTATFKGDNAFYTPIERYEGRHRYDPDFQWEPKEGKKLVRKLDKRICAWVCLMFFALQLDRGNITQALSDNMLDDLHMNTNDYNTGQTIFYISFLCAELPSQLISKKLGPDN